MHGVMNRSYKDFMLGVLLGGSLGALLFNTKSGKKVQKESLEKYHKVAHAAHDFLKKKTKKIASAKSARKRKKKK